MSANQEQLDQNIKENWLAGTGVRKPYTVFVCIMAIIILGVFAFSKMSVDLFPAMNLPYAVVVLSPNQSYVMNQVEIKTNDYFDMTDPNAPTPKAKAFTALKEKSILNAKELYHDNAQYLADKEEFNSIKNDNTQLSLAASRENPNLIAKYYSDVLNDANQLQAVIEENIH